MKRKDFPDGVKVQGSLLLYQRISNTMKVNSAKMNIPNDIKSLKSKYLKGGINKKNDKINQ